MSGNEIVALGAVAVLAHCRDSPAQIGADAVRGVFAGLVEVLDLVVVDQHGSHRVEGNQRQHTGKSRKSLHLRHHSGIDKKTDHDGRRRQQDVVDEAGDGAQPAALEPPPLLAA